MNINDIFVKYWKRDNFNVNNEPSHVSFNNMTAALEMLHYHLEKRSKFGFLADVDWDGIISTHIGRIFIKENGGFLKKAIINRRKEHGIQFDGVRQFNESEVNIVVIPDSSSNSMDILKELKCDVLVLDHHKIDGETTGFTNDGHKIIIVNSTLDGEFIHDSVEINKGSSLYSAGLLVYEFLRTYEIAYNTGILLEDRKLYELAATTLLSDIIDTRNDRAIYYLKKTFNNSGHSTLIKDIINNKYGVNKSTLLYSIIPVLNKAIRAEQGALAFKIISNAPKEFFDKLSPFGEEQEQVLKRFEETKKYVELENIAAINMYDLQASKNYTGVVAAKLAEVTNKPAIAVCVTQDGLLVGSFRGRPGNDGFDYNAEVKKVGAKAEGHEAAFGIQIREEEVYNLSKALGQNEIKREESYVVIEPINKDDFDTDKNVIVEDFKSFVSAGYLSKIGEGNSLVRTVDQIYMMVPKQKLRIKQMYDKMTVYEFNGLELKSFKEITDDKYVRVYAEKQGAFTELYIK